MPLLFVTLPLKDFSLVTNLRECACALGDFKLFELKCSSCCECVTMQLVSVVPFAPFGVLVLPGSTNLLSTLAGNAGICGATSLFLTFFSSTLSRSFLLSFSLSVKSIEESGAVQCRVSSAGDASLG